MGAKMDRREFMTKASVAVLGSGIPVNNIFGLHAAGGANSRVIEVYHPDVVHEDRSINPDAVGTMLRQGMMKLGGGEAPWARFLSPGDRVGLKINTLGRPVLFTHHELIQAVIEDLKSFGIRENDIIVWDRWEHHMTASGFLINTSDRGVRIYGTEGRGVSTKRIDADAAFESDFDTVEDRDGGTASHFSSIFTRDCDKIINMAILKDHDSSGYTMCLKNLAFGVTTNNGRFHKPSHIGPFIAGVCATPEVRKKVALHIIDGLEGCYDRGPVPDGPRVLFSPKTLWIGTDPVALDAVSRQVIDEERVRRGLPLLKDTPGYHSGMRPVDHVELSAEKGAGICDPERISIEKVILPDSG